MVSQYHFRGIQQTAGASASAGLDYEEGSLSLGTWAADVDDGLEIDFYGAYEFELENGLTLGAGATTYQYTGDFDSAYNEVNLSAGYGAFSLGYSIGKWDGEVGNEDATESDYTILTLGFEHKGFSGEIGIYGDEAEGEYFDLAYGTEIGGFDVSVGTGSWIGIRLFNSVCIVGVIGFCSRFINMDVVEYSIWITIRVRTGINFSYCIGFLICSSIICRMNGGISRVSL